MAKAILYRFIRGGLAGAVATASTVTYFTGVSSWTALGTALSMLAVCGVIGFLTGGIMALDKWFRANSADYQ